jgi:hypothetical protein
VTFLAVTPLDLKRRMADTETVFQVLRGMTQEGVIDG